MIRGMHIYDLESARRPTRGLAWLMCGTRIWAPIPDMRSRA